MMSFTLDYSLYCFRFLLTTILLGFAQMVLSNILFILQVRVFIPLISIYVVTYQNNTSIYLEQFIL